MKKESLFYEIDPDTGTKLFKKWIIWPAFILMLALWLSTFFVINNYQQPGTIGDSFGMVNALFSGLAFGLLIFTSLMQRDELALQRHELKEARHEYQKQNTTLSSQRFESTLFHLIRSHHEIIDKLTFNWTPNIGEPAFTLQYSSDTIKYEKRDVLYKCEEILKSRIHDVMVNNQLIGNKNYDHNIVLEKLREAYVWFYKEDIKQLLSHYFRNIYHIFRFIYVSGSESEKSKKMYGSLVRAQLSPPELYLLFYNSIVPNLGYPNFLYLMKEYKIVSNLDKDAIELDLIWDIFYKEMFATNEPNSFSEYFK